MGEVVQFDPAAERPLPPKRPPPEQVSSTTYFAYQQAEAAFRALYFGRPLDPERFTNCPSTKIVQQHWSAVQQLAEIFLHEKSVSREQVLKLLLHASLSEASVSGRK
jgi:hypothetical protein